VELGEVERKLEERRYFVPHVEIVELPGKNQAATAMITYRAMRRTPSNQSIELDIGGQGGIGLTALAIGN
jgi:hypothetical protein